MSDFNDALDALNRLKAEQANPAALSVLESVIKADLSANGGEAAEDVAHIFPDDLEHLRNTEGSAMVYSVPMGDPERGKTVPLYHPAPPSVAVPEGWKLERDGGFYLLTSPSGDMHQVQPLSFWPEKVLAQFMEAMLTAAPQPDHIADAGKVVWPGIVESAHELLDAILAIPERKLLALDNDQHPPSVLSVLAARLKDALSATPSLPEEDALQALDKWARIKTDFEDFDGDRRGIAECLRDAEQELLRAQARLNTAGDDGEGV